MNPSVLKHNAHFGGGKIFRELARQASQWYSPSGVAQSPTQVMCTQASHEPSQNIIGSRSCVGCEGESMQKVSMSTRVGCNNEHDT